MIISILYFSKVSHPENRVSFPGRTTRISAHPYYWELQVCLHQGFSFEFYRIVLLIREGLRIWMFSNSIKHSICFSTVLAKPFYCSKTFSTICTSKYTFGLLLIVVHIVLKLHTPSNKNWWQHIIGDYIIKCLCNIIFDIKSMCMCVCFVLIYS